MLLSKVFIMPFFPLLQSLCVLVHHLTRFLTINEPLLVLFLILFSNFLNMLLVFLVHFLQECLDFERFLLSGYLILFLNFGTNLVVLSLSCDIVFSFIITTFLMLVKVFLKMFFHFSQFSSNEFLSIFQLLLVLRKELQHCVLSLFQVFLVVLFHLLLEFELIVLFGKDLLLDHFTLVTDVSDSLWFSSLLVLCWINYSLEMLNHSCFNRVCD